MNNLGNTFFYLFANIVILYMLILYKVKLNMSIPNFIIEY